MKEVVFEVLDVPTKELVFIENYVLGADNLILCRDLDAVDVQRAVSNQEADPRFRV